MTFTVKNVPLVRLYFNSFDANNAWSIDFGRGSVEIQCSRLYVGRVPSMVESARSESPCAWLLFQGVDVIVEDNSVTLGPPSDESTA